MPSVRSRIKPPPNTVKSAKISAPTKSVFLRSATIVPVIVKAIAPTYSITVKKAFIIKPSVKGFKIKPLKPYV